VLRVHASAYWAGMPKDFLKAELEEMRVFESRVLLLLVKDQYLEVCFLSVIAHLVHVAH